ncbi:MAG: extracellular solute-binding protein [Oscillospiraceae bacterium]|nr:extracellular solute-binding protein [Oscillospiraceae bacterium]
MAKLKSSKLKIIISLIILTLIISMFTACGGNTEETKKTDGNTISEKEGNNETGDDNDSGEAPAEVKLLPDLGDANFEGYTFRVIVRNSSSGDWLDWNPRDVYAAEENGDTINDAVYKRNVYIEDKYNFKIEETYRKDNDVGSDVNKAVKSGDDIYDMAEVQMRNAPSLALTGIFLNLHEVENLELTQPWWDQAANSALSFGGKLFFTSGDLLMVNNDTCTGFVFNKELLKDLALDDPYPIVKEGKWTMDKLYDMCKDASMDLNGDGQMNYTDDRYGLIGQRDTLISFLHGANEYITKKDENDYPYIVFGGERSFAAMEACYKVMYNDFTHNAHHIEGKVPAIYPVSEEIFMSNRALFMWVRLRIVENLRSMDKDFGILPIPKLNENQDDYYTDVISHTGLIMCVPVTASDPARTGHILEAICAESKYTTMPAYYEVTLKTKMARDDSSADMLDIIFKNRVWDLGEIANYGNFSSDLIWMSMKNNSDLASLFDKLEPKMQKDIDKAIEKFEKID